MKQRKGKLTRKLITSSVVVFILTMFIPNIIWRALDLKEYFDPNNPELHADPEGVIWIMLFVGALTVFTTITIYGLLVDRIVLKRIKSLNKATEQVISGNFDTVVDDSHNDEISQLSSNYNAMVKGLKNNEYLNKEFVRNFSHELKTPLSAIKGYADLINTTKPTKEEAAEYSRIISEEADRLSELSRNMLLISLVDSQIIINKNDTFNVSEQIRNVIQLTQLQWEEKQIELDLNMEKVTITSNKELLYQVWTNLFSNAVKFSQQNDKIAINLSSNMDTLTFSITNAGTIEQSDQKQIFNLFFVSEKSRNKQSSGVGLTLTRKIVNKLNGNISFTSKNSKTTFVVELQL